MLILFDLDDTLMDDRTAERSAAKLLHKGIATTIPEEEFLSRWSDALKRHFRRYLAGEISFQGQRRARIREFVARSLSDEAADRVFAGYHANYEANWSLFSDALSCLDDLSEFPIGLITNGQGDQQRLKLTRMGILERFRCVLISEECGCAKPDPAIFLRACASVGELPEHGVYIGDRYDIDAQAARQAGLKGIWLDRNASASASHSQPIIQSLSELRNVLQRVE